MRSSCFKRTNGLFFPFSSLFLYIQKCFSWICFVRKRCLYELLMFAYGCVHWKRKHARNKREIENQKNEDIVTEKKSWNRRKMSLEAATANRLTLTDKPFETSICIVGRFNIKAFVRLRIYYKSIFTSNSNDNNRQQWNDTRQTFTLATANTPMDTHTCSQRVRYLWILTTIE